MALIQQLQQLLQLQLQVQQLQEQSTGEQTGVSYCSPVGLPFDYC